MDSLTDPTVVAACLYGDALLAAQGHPAYGIPHLTGFQVGYEVFMNSGVPDFHQLLSTDWQQLLQTAG